MANITKNVMTWLSKVTSTKTRKASTSKTVTVNKPKRIRKQKEKTSVSLSLKMVVEPSLSGFPIEYSPLCIDNKIHIRFRDYGAKEVIAGFEDKLTYMLTYLFNKEFTPTIEEFEGAMTQGHSFVWSRYLPLFMDSQSYKEIESVISKNIVGYSGILLTPKYVKKPYTNPWEQFGSIQDGASIPSTGPGGEGILKQFLSVFKVSLEDYLFNDSYQFVIDEKMVAETINSKFIKKGRPNKEVKDIKVEVPELW